MRSNANNSTHKNVLAHTLMDLKLASYKVELEEKKYCRNKNGKFSLMLRHISYPFKAEARLNVI
jgi:hypothetical protein